MKKKIEKLLFTLCLFSFSILTPAVFSVKNAPEKNYYENRKELEYQIEYLLEENTYIPLESIHLQSAAKEEIPFRFKPDALNFFELIIPGQKKTKILKNKGQINIFINADKSESVKSIEYTVGQLPDHKQKFKNDPIHLPPHSYSQKLEEITFSSPNKTNQDTTEKENIIKESDAKNLSLIDRIIEYTKNKNIFLISLIALFLGLLMSLTPCIYPMIPITISILGIDKKPFFERLEAGLLYITGISITFSFLGLLTSSGKIFFGQLFSFPIFTLLITLLLISMTLNMLDITNPIFSINNMQYIPKSLTNHRYLPLIYGIFSGTITSPCVSPGLIAVLSLVSQQENFYTGWILLFMFGIGLSLPLLLIALIFNSHFIFPQSGSWMITIKEIIGCLLCIIIYNNILHFAHPIIAISCIIILLGIFIVHKYVYFDTHLNKKTYWFCSYSVLAALGVALLLGVSTYQKIAQKNTPPYTEKISLIWHSHLTTAQEEALKNNTLLLVDITAEWCSICQIVDKKIFKNIEIMKKIIPFCTLVKIDCTILDQKKEQLIKKYKIDGFPSILLIDPKEGQVISSFHGELIEPGVAEQFINTVSRNSQKN
jgi:thiol:disulfide interchange protein DsbD